MFLPAFHPACLGHVAAAPACAVANPAFQTCSTAPAIMKFDEEYYSEVVGAVGGTQGCGLAGRRDGLKFRVSKNASNRIVNDTSIIRKMKGVD